MNFRWACLSLLVLSSACGPRTTTTQLRPDRVFTSYSAYYDAADQSLEVSVAFLEGNAGGRTLQLDGKSRVEFDSQALSLTPLQPHNRSHYLKRTEKAESALSATHQFNYTDTKGIQHRVAFVLPSLLVAQLTTDRTSLDNSVAIQWSSAGETLDSDILYLHVKALDGERAPLREDLTEDVRLANAGAHTLTTAALHSWGAGRYQVQLCRQRVETPKSVTKAGGSLFLTTCGSPIALEITP